MFIDTLIDLLVSTRKVHGNIDTAMLDPTKPVTEGHWTGAIGVLPQQIVHEGKEAVVAFLIPNPQLAKFKDTQTDA